MDAEHIAIECLSNPLGIDSPNPRFGWTAATSEKKQTAYEIIAATSENPCNETDSNLWNTGKVLSSENAQIEYEGLPLPPRTRVYCSIRLWDGQDEPGSPKTAWFETGLMDQADWQAQWIETPNPEAAPLFRREFMVPDQIVQARAYICGLGFYELYLNGSRIGDSVLVPAQTNYDERQLGQLLYPFQDKTKKRVLYNTYDIASQLIDGINTIGIVLGNGWYNQRDRTVEGEMWYGSPRVIAQIELTDASGNLHIIGTDSTWATHQGGPLLHNGIFSGERFDARRKADGWASTGHNDAGWTPAQEARPPCGILRSQTSPVDRVVSTFTPALISATDGVFRFDAGRNVSGWARIRLNTEAGRTITLRFIEDTGEDYGQSDTYIAGGKDETYEPSFTWHSFRYVEITGAPDSFSVQDIDIREVHADISPAGAFQCSDDTLNTLYRLFRDTQRQNMHCGVPSDCPHRERLGYTGDGQIAAEAAMHAFDMAAFYTKWIDDIADAQNQETGFVPHTAPFGGGGGGQPWGSALVVVPWLMHRFYGDRRVLANHYDAMKHWLRYYAACRNENGVVTREEPESWFLGEWCTPSGTQPEIPAEYVNTCYLGYNALLMRDISRTLGNQEDAEFYAELHASVAETINREYFDPTTGNYSIGCEGANEFALMFDLVPEGRRSQVAGNIAANVARNGHHLDTGYSAPRCCWPRSPNMDTSTMPSES